MALFCSRALGALAGNYSGLYLRSLSVRYRSALCVLLHNKTLALGDARPKTPAPDLAVLAEVDTMTLYRCAQAYPDVWTFPIQVFLCLGGLAYLLPWQAFLAVVILIALASSVLGLMLRSMAFWISANMSAKDERATLVGEVLNSITAIKMHAWESVLARLVAERRREELKTLQKSALSASGLVTYMQSMPAALTIVAFGVMLLLHVPLTNGLIFTLIILFTMLNASLTQVSTLASNLQLVKTSATRVVSYLNLSQDNISVELDGLSGSRAWSKDTALTTNIMRAGWPGGNILISSGSLAVPPGSLSAITGSMGSGKSTLLLALAREAQKRHRVAYVGQKPTMIGGSLRDNILFGQPYDDRRYKRVIHACCLDTDFSNLHHGDSTLVAGTSALSGGQCARICLARAAYSQADLFALDDPLAALDVRVSATIVRRLLGPTGLLGRSTRIICTSHPLVLAQATFTYLIENGSLRTVESKDAHLDELLSPPETSPQTHDPPVFEVTKHRGADAIKTNAPLAKLAPIVDVHVAEESLEGGSMAPLNGEPTNKKATSANPRGALYGYLSSCKKLGWPLALGILLLARMSSVSGTYVLKILATQTSETDLFRCLGLFGILSLSQGACFYIFVYTLYALCIVPAATALHAKLTAGVLLRDLSYFQTTPSANILNLFTNDVGRVDGSLNGSLASLAGQYVNLTLSCSVLIAAMPVSVLFVVPLMAACHYIQRAYLVKLRQLRHLDAESRAPLLECLQEAESGRVLFSMHGMQERRKDDFDEHIAFNVRAVWPLACTDLWIAVRLEILSIVLQVAAAGALLASSAEPGILGFVMTYVFQVTGTLSNIAKVTAQFESDAVSVTRIAEASDSDAAFVIDAPELMAPLLAPYSDSDHEQAWPHNGRVEFRNVSARHRPGLPDSLNSISFSVNPGEKVAIIGRTGAGKSSMVLALLKLMDQTAGQILVDDVDVASVGDVRLRTSLAVVPQTQLIFSGTVRQNLDPMGLSDDDGILDALRICGGLSIVHKMLGVGEDILPEGAALLDTVVGPKSNLSKGELQLLLLARAVVQRSKVLVMDEATSGMDAAGEARCHDVIFGELRSTTTLAVLHRLELTLHYDRVLVLDHGKVAAFDTPAALLGRGEGPYYDMIAESAELLEQAMKMYGIGH
ncbi:P-loop containing nucleoside triphosphate hydrolase protein [Plectosphaerella cucumerina]|uniref:P-loop containing nucleoside triphosphate hydrolase protein n=1 Tax=Plectosphaerella cucumerina TaxID=40658 RepID=A0A8K0X5B4_9PEZI|nr:P-loop containing nucleoside triphosphate hydrolase protein [Plectosphaerella cucumerina]